MLRLPMFCGLGILCLTLLVGAGVSQDAKKDKDDKKEPGKTKGFLPAGFKDLGLTAEQKSKVYAVQGEFRVKMAEFDKKIKDLKKQEQQEVFKVLTEEQRDKYLKSKGVETKDKAGEKKDADKK